MALSNGWFIVQRELTGSIQVMDAPEVWATAVFSTPSRRIAGSHLAGTPHDSLAGAVHQAAHEPLPGAPTGRPAVVLAAPDLVNQVRGVLGKEGIRAGVDEALPPDWAEDIFAELTGHLAGRQQAADPPEPQEWALLHQQAAAYAQARPWDRRADDVHLRLELKIGSTRTDVVAIVLGNSGLTRGLAICPGRVVPEAMFMGEEGIPPPEGTSHFSLIRREEAPTEMQERAERYGWPAELDAPLFIEMGPGGPQEIGREHALILTVALAAALDHDRQGAGFGMKVQGEILLASGRRGRYLAQLEPNVPLDVPPGLKLMSGEVRHDLLPEKTVVGLGGLPWEELEWVSSHADRHLAAHLQRSPAGDAFPILILGVGGAEGERVARELYDARPEGVALVEVGDEVLAVILTGSGMHGVANLPAGDLSVARFRRRLAATGGWHGIVVGSSSGRREDPIHCFIECVLLQPPGPMASPMAGRPKGHPGGPRKRKYRRGR